MKPKVDNRVPVISDPDEMSLPWQTLQTIIAGRSLIDTSELHVENLDEARKFLESYGLDDSDNLDRLRRTALTYIQQYLLADSRFCLPENVHHLSLPDLLLAASSFRKTTTAEWACLILKVCHAVAHAQWTRDEEAYNGALAKIRARLEPYLTESADGIWIGDDGCRIPLVEYRIKSEKLFTRLVTKLLLKEGNLSAGVFDHIGMRFVTRDIFSAILLIKFLRTRHVFMYANILPQESKNSLAEFHQIEALFSEFSGPIEEIVTEAGRNRWLGSENPYSSQSFRMIKIIERVLVTTPAGRKVFFPCEFQILTQQAYAVDAKKETDHSAYEKRQIRGVRRRLFKGTSLAAG